MYRKILGVLIGMLITVCIGVNVVAAAATKDFKDPLDLPAVKSKFAEKCVFQSVVLVGKRLVGAGQFGNILYSDDRGKNWIQAAVPVSTDIVAMNFPTEKKGWAVGHDGVILHTEDGGATWMKQLDRRGLGPLVAKYYKENPPKTLPKLIKVAEGELAKVASGMLTTGISMAEQIEDFNKAVARFSLPEDSADDPSLLDVYFENENSGFVVGTFNMLLRTTDGGKTWIPWCHRTENQLFKHMYAIKGIDGDIFIVGEQGIVMKYDRKTEIFRRILTPYIGPYFGVSGKDGKLLAYGMRGNIYLSSDKGFAKWNKIATLVVEGVTCGAVTPDGRVMLVSQLGDVIISTDAKWQGFKKVDAGIVTPITAITVIDKDTYAVAGFGGLMVKKYN